MFKILFEIKPFNKAFNTKENVSTLSRTDENVILLEYENMIQ